MPVPKKKATAPAKPPVHEPRRSAILDPATPYVLLPNEPFLLRHHFANWSVGEVPGKEGTFLLPDVDHQPVLPGVGKFHTLKRDQDPKVGYLDEIKNAEKDGWMYLRPEAPEAEGGRYVCEAPCESPMKEAGTFYHDPWTTILPDRTGKMAKTKFDFAAFNLWRHDLVVNGIIPPPTEGTQLLIAARYRKHAARAVADYKVPEPVRKIVADREEARAERAEKAKVPGETGEAAA